MFALVVDHYPYCPHLDRKYQSLYRKPLARRLEEQSRAFYAWLRSLADLSSLSMKPSSKQTPFTVFTKFQQLPATYPNIHEGSRLHWVFHPRQSPITFCTLEVSTKMHTRRKRKIFKGSIVSSQARGRSERILAYMAQNWVVCHGGTAWYCFICLPRG